MVKMTHIQRTLGTLKVPRNPWDENTVVVDGGLTFECENADGYTIYTVTKNGKEIYREVSGDSQEWDEAEIENDDPNYQ